MGLIVLTLIVNQTDYRWQPPVPPVVHRFLPGGLIYIAKQRRELLSGGYSRGGVEGVSVGKGLYGLMTPNISKDIRRLA